MKYFYLRRASRGDSMKIGLGCVAIVLGVIGHVGGVYAHENAPSDAAPLVTESSAGTAEICFFCGEWKPLSKVPQQPHLPGERFVASKSSLALPGCESVKVIPIFTASEADNISNHVSLDFLNSSRLANRKKRVLFITEKGVACTKPLADIAEGTLVAMSIIERGGLRDVLIVSLFSPALSEVSHASPTNLSIEELRQIKRILRPKQQVYWELIHKDFNGCDDGYDLSAVVCSDANLYEADGKLNVEWRSLNSMLSDIERKEVVAQQQKWLKNADKKCQNTNGDGWNGRWLYSFETNCKAALFEKRSLQFRSYRDCVVSGNLNCKDLSDNLQ
jgi:uncharacterized protein YecT (DUF1311 family)